jgi:hypothetical protein
MAKKQQKTKNSMRQRLDLIGTTDDDDPELIISKPLHGIPVFGLMIAFSVLDASNSFRLLWEDCYLDMKSGLYLKF